jgi:hypothetical protein
MSRECASEMAWCWSREGFCCRKAAVYLEIGNRATGPEARCRIVYDIRIAVGYCGKSLLGIANSLEVGRTNRSG